jgi:enoyl-CoA hydratase/carnithine racemase
MKLRVHTGYANPSDGLQRPPLQLQELVASIRFNRPSSPNALTIGMLGEISDANNS